MLQAARDAARRADARARAGHADPDAVYSLYRFGFEVDERVDERLLSLKHTHPNPVDALPALAEVLGTWDRDAFAGWLDGLGPAPHKVTPSGRLVPDPGGLDRRADRLAAALLPLGDRYPLPHVLA